MRHRVIPMIVLALLGAAACGGADSTPGTAPRAPAPATPAVTATGGTPAPRCHAVPRTTVRLIASHGTRRTQFAATGAAAVHVDAGYAVSLVAVTAGSQRMATWFVDRLRAPQTVSSGNVAALRVTNWPLRTIGPEPARQSQLCATQRMRGPGPLAP